MKSNTQQINIHLFYTQIGCYQSQAFTEFPVSIQALKVSDLFCLSKFLCSNTVSFKEVYTPQLFFYSMLNCTIGMRTN